MEAGVVLGLSALLQFVAAGCALWLIRITGRRLAWVLIASAITLMGVRRSIALYRLLSGDLALPPDPAAELVALLISILMLIGVAWIAPLFLSIRRADDELRKVNRALRTLSQCNQVLIRATVEAELLHEVCRVIVEAGGYRLAWVGFADDDEAKTVRPVAQAGYEEGYLDTLKLTWADTGPGRGPTGTAIRMGSPQIVQHILTDPRFEPWRAEASKRGYASSAALPLIAEGRVFGTLNVYAAERDAFGAEEVKLLSELTNDLAYGITAMRTRGARRRAEDRFGGVLEAAPDAIVAVSATGNIEFVNAQAEKLFGYRREELVGEPVEILMPERFRHEHPRHRAGYVAAPRTRSMGSGMNLFGVRKDGSEFPVDISLSPVHTEEGILAVSAIRDVTERVRAEETLRKSEARLGEAQRVAHLGNWDWNIVTNELWWSDEIYRIFGLAPQQFGATYEAFLATVHPDDRDVVREAVNRALYEREPYSIDHRIVLPDGTERTVHEQAEVTFDETGKPVRMVGTVQDITERVRAEEALRQSREELRRLAARLQAVREEERTDIAREIHDELGQALTALKMDLSWLKGRLPKGGRPLLRRAESMISLVDDTIDATRDLSARLRPAVLDDLGLVAAIEWQAQEFRKRSGIDCTVDVSDQQLELDPGCATAVFRILQETLTNVARHAQASRVDVRLGTIDGGLVLEVRDDGKGISESDLWSAGSLGLLGMRERARALAGTVHVRPGAEGGTEVTVTIPL